LNIFADITEKLTEWVSDYPVWDSGPARRDLFN